MARYLYNQDLREVNVYDVVPTDNRKSCGGKAKVVAYPDGSQTLFSYGLGIMTKYPGGRMERHWDGWSSTTGRHIKYFSGLNKREYEALLLVD